MIWTVYLTHLYVDLAWKGLYGLLSASCLRDNWAWDVYLCILGNRKERCRYLVVF